MKTTMAMAAALLACGVGCDTKEATGGGKEAFEKIQKAEREKDAAAFWNLLSKKSREAADQEKVKKELETPKYANAKFVEEKVEGDKVTVTIEVDGKKSDLVLVKEDGALHLER